MIQATKERERMWIVQRNWKMLLSDFGEVGDLCEMEILVRLEIVVKLEILVERCHKRERVDIFEELEMLLLGS